MKKLVIFLATIFLIIFLITLPSYSAENKMCRENPEQVCKEHENILIVLIFGEPKEKISAEFLFIFQSYEISSDGSENDPLCEKFYEL